MNAISLKDVCLRYKVDFKENGRIVSEGFWALKEINLDIKKGETVCLIGENGAGKTSLLKVIAGMLMPDNGSVQVEGAVSSLMEVGAGFHKDLTGKENIYLISSLFGLSKEQISLQYNDIINFAAIGRFINAPVKSYSQGMYMRLGFAIAIHVDPDILIIDDTFAVGDIYAQRKCINKIFELKEMGKTIIFVTHDLEMAKRICSRGIFLREGAIIKDGPIDKVSVYYAETVGRKEGIAIAQEGALGIVFNNGKLVLKWKDEIITCNSGGHNCILVSERKYLSTTADWQIEKAGTDKEIIAVGRWPDIHIKQCWRIRLLNEKEFLWEVMLQGNDGISVEKIDTRIFFIDAYKGWFTLDNEMSFPKNFIHELESENFTIDSSIDGIIGIKGNDGEGPLPIIIFDRLLDNTKMVSQVGNTGSAIGGRLIQYQLFSASSGIKYIEREYSNFLSKIRIFEQEEVEKLKNYLNYSKQIARKSTVIRQEAITICCEDKKIKVFWKNRLLTEGVGLKTKFRYEDRDYSSTDGRWVITKKNNKEAVVTISWADEPSFIQAWTLKLSDDNTILLEIEMDINRKAKLRNKQIELVLSQEYENWVTMEERGNFQRLEKIGSGVVLGKYINSYIGVDSIYRNDTSFLPGILFSYEDGARRVSYISKIKEDGFNANLRYLEIDSKENYYTEQGKYKYFRGGIKITGNNQREGSINKFGDGIFVVDQDDNLPAKLEVGRLSTVFNHGQGRILWKGVEFTKSLGMYSSVCFKGIWHDSSQAHWKVEKIDKVSLVATGHWPWVPLIQLWEIRILDENIISWNIAKEIWEDISLDREQINIMLSGKYKEWFIHKQLNGRFPDKFTEHNGIFWDRLGCINKGLPMGAKKCKIKNSVLNIEYLPSVIFSCSKDCQARYSVIENTDNLFQARILQYDLGLNHEVVSNKTKYFEGQIKIAF